MKRSTSWIAVLPSLVIPVSLGLTMYLGLSFLMARGIIDHPLVIRYLTGHPISQVTVAMFLVGCASLAAIAKNVAEQFLAERKITLSNRPATAAGTEGSAAARSDRESATDTLDPVDGKAETRSSMFDADALTLPPSIQQTAGRLEESLQELPEWMQEHYLWQRLSAALAHIDRTRSPSGVEEELKYLGELDLERQQQRYSLARILIWATPMLGFLGTVLGISEALGGINIGPDQDFQAMMNGLRSSLYVAFDTTALALTLSMLLMFAQFLVDRFESQLLTLVDQRAHTEIARQFDLARSGQDLNQDLLAVSRDSVEQQVAIWKQTIRAAEAAWASSLTDANATVQTNLSVALDKNVSNLARSMSEAIEKADEAMSHRWQQWQVTLSDNARAMAEHQKELAAQARQIESMLAGEQGTEGVHEAMRQNESALVATEQLCATLESLQQAVAALRDRDQALVTVPGPWIETAGPADPSAAATPTPVDDGSTLPADRESLGTNDGSSAEERTILKGDFAAQTADTTAESAELPSPIADDAEVIIQFRPSQTELHRAEMDQTSARVARFLSERRKRPAA